MAESRQAPNVLARGIFWVFDSSNAAVTGLTQSNFTIALDYNGVASSVAVTIGEIGSGIYYYTFTPDAIGYWYLRITNATYNPRGWDEDFDVVQVGGSGGQPFIEYYEGNDFHERWMREYSRLEKLKADRVDVEKEEAALIFLADDD